MKGHWHCKKSAERAAKLYLAALASGDIFSLIFALSLCTTPITAREDREDREEVLSCDAPPKREGTI
jgi:hypothetical protein